MCVFRKCRLIMEVRNLWRGVQLFISKYQLLIVFVSSLYLEMCVMLSCLVVFDSLPPLYGASVHGVLQARKLQYVAVPFSGDLPDRKIKPTSPVFCFFCTGRQILYHRATWEAVLFGNGTLSKEHSFLQHHFLFSN